MTLSVGIAFAGIAVLALGVMLRRRVGTAWMISLIVAGVLVCGCGCILLNSEISQRQQERETLYLGLRYLERYDFDSAEYYLKQIDASQSFASAGARTALEKATGNELSGRLNLDIADSLARTQPEMDQVSILRSVSTDNYQETIPTLVKEFIRSLNLADRRMEAMDLFMDLEAGTYVSDEDMGKLSLDQDDADRVSISANLRNQSYGSAVTEAVALVDRHPTEENRLLLAETVAEAGYAGFPLTAANFAKTDPDNPDQAYFLDPNEADPSVMRELDQLEEERLAAEDDLATLDLSIQGARNDEELQNLNARKLELTQRIEQLQQDADKLFVRRAFNAIADLNSLHARIVRARLHFALLHYDEAVETLLNAATSLPARLSTDDMLKSRLQILANTYESSDTFYETPEFADTMTGLLTAPFPDLMYISQSPLTVSFTERIISDQKTYGNSLSVSRFDVSAFPKVSLNLVGRTELLEQIVEKSEITSRDTRETVSYTATLDDSHAVDIVMLLDHSGSMAGEPIRNLKEAVTNFVDDMESGTRLSLVAFDDSADRLTELTDNQANLTLAVSGLTDEGGTDITCGIQEGLNVLQDSAGNRAMVLMTDGQSDINMDVVQQAASQGITIYTVGFGDVNDTLLQQIADTTGGQYIRADSSSELSNVYASLQQIIGNIVTVEYTVTSTTEQYQRYFFLDVDGYTVYWEYSLAKPETVTAELRYSNPTFLTTGQLTDMVTQNRMFSMNLFGSHLSQVTGITVNGAAAVIKDQSDDRITLEASPSLPAGWVPIVVTLADGTQLHADHFLYVGDTQYFSNLRLGSLIIRNATGVLAGNGTLVLGGDIRITDNVPEGTEGSLDLAFTGTMVVPWTPAPGMEAEVRNVDLGDSGTIEAWGTFTLNRADDAYMQDAPGTIAHGHMHLQCGPAQSQLTILPGEEAVQP